MVYAMRLPSENARYAQERRKSARRGAGIAMVDAMRLPSGNARYAQERRASARRGWVNAYPQTRASFVGRPPTVCVRIAVAVVGIGATGLT